MVTHINCADCGERLVWGTLDPDEMVVNGTTVHEHMEQTGHQPQLEGHAVTRYDSEAAREERRRQVEAKRGRIGLDRLEDLDVIDYEIEQPFRNDARFGVTWVVPKDKCEASSWGDR